MTDVNARISATRLNTLFGLVDNPVAGLFLGCPELDKISHGPAGLLPRPSAEDSAKLAKMFGQFINTGDFKDLSDARAHAYRSVHARSVNYTQAGIMCAFGVAMAQTDSVSTNQVYEKKVREWYAGDKKGGKPDRMRQFFDSVCVNDEVPATVGVGDTDVVGVVSVAAAHSGFRTRIAIPRHPAVIENNLIRLTTTLRLRDAARASDVATYMVVDVPLPAVAKVGAVFIANKGDAVTSTRPSEDATITTGVQKGSAQNLVPSEIGAFIVNCDYSCLAACDAAANDECKKRVRWLHRGGKEPHPMDVLTKNVIAAKNSLDFLMDIGKEFSRPIVTLVPSQEAAARLARAISNEFKSSKLDIATFESPAGYTDGVVVAIRAIPAQPTIMGAAVASKANTKAKSSGSSPSSTDEMRAVHLASALWWMERGNQQYTPERGVVNSLLAPDMLEFYLKQYVDLTSYAYYDYARLYINGKLIPLMNVLTRYLARVHREASSSAARAAYASMKSANDPSKTSAPAPAAAAAAQTKDGPQKGPGRKRNRGRDRDSGGKTTTPMKGMGCVSCKEPSGNDALAALYV